MTYEEALEHLNDVMNSTIKYDESLDYQLTSYDLDWVDKAREALEKQIPKRPTETNRKTVYRCANCKAIVMQNLSTEKTDYCVRCGQAIDWSEE